jgi:CRISPR-associated protein Cmr3
MPCCEHCIFLTRTTMNDNNNPGSTNYRTRNYRVTLNPLGNFFFGGQKLTEVEDEKDYYIKSRFYPQQTVILGMLRQELLIQNSLFPLEKSNREKAARLIGASSFDPEIREQDFGVIENLSPVFIKRKENRVFHVLPKDFGHPYTPDPEGKTFFNHPAVLTREFIPYFDGYKAKEDRPEKLVAKTPSHENIDLKDIFIPDEQIGIKKGTHGQTEEEGYYKQVFLRLKKGYAFSFYLKLKAEFDGIPVRFADSFVFIGGERSGFKMEVERVDEADENKTVRDLFDQTLPEFQGPKIVLTGDAFVEPEIFNLCDFAAAGSVFFRNFRSYVKTTRKYWNLTNRKNDKETPFLGDRYNLLSRGTVLYYGDNPGTLKEITELLDIPGCKKIGFNYFKIYPSKEEKGKG